ncbi:boron transporter 4-like protein [Tanacetum coccineum]
MLTTTLITLITLTLTLTTAKNHTTIYIIGTGISGSSLSHFLRHHTPPPPNPKPHHPPSISSTATPNLEALWPPLQSEATPSKQVVEDMGWGRFLLKTIDSSSKSAVVRYLVSVVNSVRMLVLYGVSLLKMNSFVEGISILGGVRDDTQFVLWNWAGGDNKKWTIVGYYGSRHAGMSDRGSQSHTRAYKKVSIIPALMIAGLYFFDHSIGLKLAQQKELNLKNPSAYHYDILLLGFMTLLCGLLGLPPSNGVLPQSPMHTKSLAVLVPINI